MGYQAGQLNQGEVANLLFFPLSRNDAQEEVQGYIYQTPHLHGLSRSRWWLKGLQEKVTWLSDCTLSGICQILKRLNISYKRGREAVHSPDLDYDLKMSYIHAAYQLAQQEPQRVILLYQDELTYYRRPSLSKGYAYRGSKHPKATQGHGSNTKRRVAGCLDAVHGQFMAWQRSSFRIPTLIAFYREVESYYPNAQTIFMVQDNWPVHFHPKILHALQDTKISLLRLPTYAPWTNPVEKVWLRLKQDLIHHHPFASDWTGLQQAVQAWLDHCDDDPQALLRAVGLSPY